MESWGVEWKPPLTTTTTPGVMLVCIRSSAKKGMVPLSQHLSHPPYRWVKTPNRRALWPPALCTQHWIHTQRHLASLETVCQLWPFQHDRGRSSSDYLLVQKCRSESQRCGGTGGRSEKCWGESGAVVTQRSITVAGILFVSEFWSWCPAEGPQLPDSPWWTHR